MARLAGIPAGFNSDDEISSEDESSHPFYNAGRRTIQDMLAFAQEDRVESKRFMKRLKDQRGAPHQAQQRQRWYNTFKTFIEEVMGQEFTTPTGAQIARFVAHIVKRLKSSVMNKPCVSKDTAQQLVYKLCKRLVVEFPDFSLSPHDTALIEVTIDDLTKNGKLTVGRWRQSQWIGFFLLRKMLLAYLYEGLERGVLSWDVRLQRCLGLVLQAAADSRAGEVTRTACYKTEEYLKWSDVQVHLVGGDELEHLVVQVELRWEKGSKNDPTSSRKVRWRPLEESASIVCDPVVLLLIHAMRTGQVAARTLDRVLELIKGNRWRHLKWERPDRPVLAAIVTHPAPGLDLDRPATTQQQHISLKEAANAAGLLNTPWTHDLRRGGAKDLRRLTGTNKQLDIGLDPRVASALGHSVQAYQRGTTERYADRESIFLFNAKEQQVANDLTANAFGMKMTARAYQPKRLASWEIDKYAASLPVGQALSRTQIGKRIHNERRRAWQEEEENIGSDYEQGTRDQRKRIKQKHVRSIGAALQERTAAQSNAIAQAVASSSVAARTKPGGNDSGAWHADDCLAPILAGDMSVSPVEPQAIEPIIPYHIIEPTPGSQIDANEWDDTPFLLDILARPLDLNPWMVNESSEEDLGPLTLDEDFAIHDDALQMIMNTINIGTVVDLDPDLTVADDDPTADRVDCNIVLEALHDTDEVRDTPLSLDLAAFVEHFARLNVFLRCKGEKPAELLEKGFASGNSRDDPSSFIKSCENGHLGCKFEAHTMLLLDQHQRSKCLFRADAPPEEVARRTQPASHKCRFCPRVFVRARYLRRHERFVHLQTPDSNDSCGSWTPKRCDRGCTSGYLYETFERYRNHIHTYHPETGRWSPIHCEFGDSCDHKKKFQSAKEYRRHLRTVHSITGEELYELVPDQRIQTAADPRQHFVPQVCPLGGCPMFERLFPDRYHLHRHLIGVAHKLSDNEARSYAGMALLDDGGVSEDALGEDDYEAVFMTDSTRSEPSNALAPAKNTLAAETNDSPEEVNASNDLNCPLGKCNHAHKPFLKRKELKRHLMSKQHNLSEDEANVLAKIPPPPTDGFPCPLTPCSAKGTFKTRQLLKMHLMRAPHFCTAVDAFRHAGLDASRSACAAKSERIVCPLGNCSMVDKSFASRAELVRHLRTREHQLSEADAMKEAGMDATKSVRIKKVKAQAKTRFSS